MNMTSIVVGKDRISLLESERYIAGTKQVYKIKATFSEDWDGLDKKLIFKTDAFEVGVDVMDGSEIFPIPWEVFAEPSNRLQVGAYGYECDDRVLNTRMLSLGRILKGSFANDCCCPPHLPTKPSPATYDKLMALITRKADRLTFEDGMFILWSGTEPLSSFEPPISLPDGGEADQVLAKASNEDGDFYWRTVEISGPTASFKVPLGTIQIWSGPLDKIPESYSLCDGQNGTPDLRSMMIVGASEYIQPGTIVEGPEGSKPSPIMALSDLDETYVEKDPSVISYYALAFVQKTSLTEADRKEGQTAYDIAVEYGFVGTEQEWLNSLKGAPGADGKSAYEIAKENGFTGTPEEFIQSITVAKNLTIKDKTVNSRTTLPVARTGSYIFENVAFTVKPSANAKMRRSTTSTKVFFKDVVYLDLEDPTKITLTTVENTKYICALDSDGSIIDISSETLAEQVTAIAGSGGSGAPGPAGADGKSAYQIAVDNGFSGTEEEWLASLKGSTGLSAYQVAKANGFDGTEAEWVESLKGADGKSAYQVAVDNGYVGTEAEWLESLKGQNGSDGDPGPEGKSAYEVAVDNGYTGTEVEWLASLKGADGKSAYQVAVENGFVGTEAEWLESLKGSGGGTTTDPNAVPVLKDKNIKTKTDLETNGLMGKSGTLHVVNTTFGAVKGRIDFVNDYIYYHATQSGLTITTLDGVKVAYTFDADGNFVLDTIKNSFDTASGPAGADGKSAYEIAVDNGFNGDEAAWLASLKGTDGAPGTNGEDGKSAYQLAVEAGFEGDEASWLASLKGADGAPGTNGSDGAPGANGADGKSAYQIAVDNGYTGSETDWLASLKGSDGAPGADGTNGADGKSAYQIAVDNGYTGTEQEWIDKIQNRTAEDTSYDDSTTNLGAVTVQEAIEKLNTAVESEPNMKTIIGKQITTKDDMSANDLLPFAGTLRVIDTRFGSAGNGSVIFSNDYIYLQSSNFVLYIYTLDGKRKEYNYSSDGAITIVSTTDAYANGSSSGTPGPAGEDGKPYLVLKAGMDNIPVVGQSYLTATEEYNRTPEDGEPFSGIITVTGTTDTVYYVAGDVTSASGPRVTFTQVVPMFGAKGDPGIPGSDGQSAYELAVDHGFEGSEEDWLASLKGATGAKGKSAYQLAVDAGFEGDEASWLASLKGAPGTDGENGSDGASAYDLALQAGFTGSEADWLESLKGQNGSDGAPGANGADGKSAYQIAVDNGYVGSETTWLASLKGEQGPAGENGKTVQTLDDYSDGETRVIGRWIDGLPVKRAVQTDRVIGISPNDTSTYQIAEFPARMMIIRMDTIASTKGEYTVGGEKFTEPKYKFRLPSIYHGIWVGLRYDVDTGEVWLTTEVINEKFASLAAELTLTVIVEYVDPNDDILTDEDMIIGGSTGGGTSDHRLLTNRDASAQHPMSAIDGLSDRLAVTPTKSVTEEQINALFT